MGPRIACPLRFLAVAPTSVRLGHSPRITQAMARRRRSTNGTTTIIRCRFYFHSSSDARTLRNRNSICAVTEEKPPSFLISMDRLPAPFSHPTWKFGTVEQSVTA